MSGLTGVLAEQVALVTGGSGGIGAELCRRLGLADGVTVNAIAPALITGTGILPGTPAEIVRRVPAGCLGTVEEVADMAMAMLENGYLTSKVIALDVGIAPL